MFPLTVEQPLDRAAHRPLAAAIEVTRAAVDDVLDGPDALTRYQGIARLSGHLAAMGRTVYPGAGHWPGFGVELKVACLSQAREVLWTMRGLECHLSGCTSAAGRPARGVALARQLDGYWPPEQALAGWVEGQLDAAGRDRLAGAYWRALGQAPTRPHPRCPRSGPLRGALFWWHRPR